MHIKRNENKKQELPVKTQDKKLILILLLIAAALMALVYLRPKTAGSRVRVSVNNQVIGVYDLQEPLFLDAGAHNHFIIENGAVYMQHADCPDQLCVKQAPISREGETIVCLPNKVILEVLGEGKNTPLPNDSEEAPALDSIAG